MGTLYVRPNRNEASLPLCRFPQCSVGLVILRNNNNLCPLETEQFSKKVEIQQRISAAPFNTPANYM